MTSTYPRETTEYVFMEVTIDGTVALTGVQFSVVPTTRGEKTRPAQWDDAVMVNNRTAWLFTPQTDDVKYLQVWAKVTDNPEIPVIDCGYITVS